MGADQICVRCNEAVCVCPQAQTICWTCERPISAGTGRVKNRWLVHELCTEPKATP